MVFITDAKNRESVQRIIAQYTQFPPADRRLSAGADRLGADPET